MEVYIHRYRMTLRAAGNARSGTRTREGFLLRRGHGFGCVQPWPELGDPGAGDLVEMLRQGRAHPLLSRALLCSVEDGRARREGRGIFAKGVEPGAIPRSHATIVTEGADFPALAAAGFRVVKLKARAGEGSLPGRVAAAARAGLRVRIDLNGTGAEGLEALRAWAADIEFIEDPEPYEAARWREITDRAGFPLALDRLPPGVADEGGYTVRVLKPALETCGPRAREVVFTSYMDHPLGQMFAAWEAARYPRAQREAGLLTHTLYEPDAFTEAVRSSGPELFPAEGTGLGFDALLEAVPWERLHPAARVTAPGRIGEGPAFWRADEPLLLTNPRAPLEDPPRVLPHGYLLFATSGSTGSPGLVCLTRQALLASAAAVNAWLEAGPGDVWLRVLPAFHVGGMGILARAFLSGSRVVEDGEKWNPERFVSTVERGGVTLTSLVPAQVHDLVAAGLPAPASLRAAVTGGGALDTGLLARARALGWPLLPSYGLTEASSQVATARPGDRGLPPALELLPCWEARVGEDGRLQLRGEPLCEGKLVRDAGGEWEFVNTRDDEGWFTAADRVLVEGRYLTIAGRADRVVKVLGELVDLDAVETTLAAAGLPPSRGVVIALPDPRAGMRPWLVTDLPEAEAAALLERVAGLLPPFAVPAGCHCLPVLSRSPLGKVLRAEAERAAREGRGE